MKRIISLIIIAVLTFGYSTTTSQSIWELYRIKYVDLLQAEPFCYAPFKSYQVIDKYIQIYDKDNMYWMVAVKDIKELVQDDAEYNKTHAPKYKGKAKTKVRKIYNYCKATTYTSGKKYAKNVFQDRQADCAGIASAFYVMCKRNGIKVRYVIGWTQTSCHAWNRVKIKGKWYWIDATQGLWLSKKQFPYRSVMEIW